MFPSSLPWQSPPPPPRSGWHTACMSAQPVRSACALPALQTEGSSSSAGASLQPGAARSAPPPANPWLRQVGSHARTALIHTECITAHLCAMPGDYLSVAGEGTWLAASHRGWVLSADWDEDVADAGEMHEEGVGRWGMGGVMRQWHLVYTLMAAHSPHTAHTGVALTAVRRRHYQDHSYALTPHIHPVILSVYSYSSGMYLHWSIHCIDD